MKTPLVFDIETGPMRLERLKTILPEFDPATVKNPGEFDPKSVKLGRIRDPEKQIAKINDDREKHELAVAEYQKKMLTAEEDHWREIQDKAALSATTGEVLAIGYRGEKQLLDYVGDQKTESTLLQRFWRQFETCRQAGRKMVGFGIAHFDVPFLIQRSWVLDVNVPTGVFTQSQSLDGIFVDLSRIWTGSARNGFVSLDAVCRACGIGCKPNGIDGKDFARLFSDPATQSQALDYLQNDLEMTWNLMERLKVS